MLLKSLITICLLFSFDQATAAPKINLQTGYFSVYGNDSSSIYQSLQQRGPIGEDGKRYHALTRWKANWSYGWRETANWCKLSRVEVSVDIEYLLPKLDSKKTKSKSLIKSWDNFFLALFKHEQQHKDYGVQAAIELEQKLLAFNKRQDCSALQQNLADAAQKVIDKYDKIEKEFDRKTNHGLKQGIKLQ